jgi:hypothetical protein
MRRPLPTDTLHFDEHCHTCGPMFCCGGVMPSDSCRGTEVNTIDRSNRVN